MEGLVSLGVLTKIECSDYAVSIAVTQKESSQIHLCAEYSIRLNEALFDPHNPMTIPFSLK